MENKDVEILRMLEEDAKLSISEIAKALELEEEEVKRKIREFEEKGIILKYKAVIDWEKVGLERVCALIDVKVAPERDKGYDSVANRIAGFPEVKALYLVSGAYDLSVLVEGRDMKEVASFVAEKLAPLERVQSTTTHFILKRYKENGIKFFGEEDKRRRLAISP